MKSIPLVIFIFLLVSVIFAIMFGSCTTMNVVKTYPVYEGVSAHILVPLSLSADSANGYPEIYTVALNQVQDNGMIANQVINFVAIDNFDVALRKDNFQKLVIELTKRSFISSDSLGVLHLYGESISGPIEDQLLKKYEGDKEKIDLIHSLSRGGFVLVTGYSISYPPRNTFNMFQQNRNQQPQNEDIQKKPLRFH